MDAPENNTIVEEGKIKSTMEDSDEDNSEGIYSMEDDSELDKLDDDDDDDGYDRNIWALSGGSPSGELHVYLSPALSRVRDAL